MRTLDLKLDRKRMQTYLKNMDDKSVNVDVDLEALPCEILRDCANGKCQRFTELSASKRWNNQSSRQILNWMI